MRRALTLIEVLVTIAAIGLLLGLMVPALRSMNAESRSHRCQANLRQMAIAAQRYAAVFDAFPAALRYESKGGSLHHIGWDWVTSSSNQPISPGPLWSFSDDPGDVQQCPDCTGKSTYGEPHTGYNYNTSFIGGEAPFGMTGWTHVRPGVPPHACRRGSDCAMFGDGGRKNEANKFMRAPGNAEGVSLSLLYAGGQAFRHGGKTNIAFVDGHIGASNTPCQGVYSTPALLTQIMDYPRNGFLSDDNRMYDPR